MKILWINTHLLHPLDRGGTIRSYNMLRCLKAAHDITYVALCEAPGGAASARAAEYCRRLVEVSWRGAPQRGSWSFGQSAAANLLSLLPLKLALYNARVLRRELRRLTSGERFDVAIADFLFSALPSEEVRDVPRILFQHNVEALIMQRMAEHARGVSRRYFASQAARMRRWEGALASRFDHVITVSENDTRLMREWYGVQHVSAVATGVDTDFYRPAPSHDSHDVVFVGSLDWLPNLDGIGWLLDEIWPRIVLRDPRARLHLVGRRPGAALRARCEGRRDVRLWADVPDVREHLSRAALVIVPLRMGGGTRLKIFEALACAKAVVSTHIGAEGLPVRAGRHLLLAESAVAFADAVVELLEDGPRRARLGTAGRELVAERFSWTRITRDFETICEAVAMRSGGSASAIAGLGRSSRESIGARASEYP